MYHDTYIEYWGDIFVAARIIEFGITFERFLRDPWHYLVQCGQESAPDCIARGMKPLLPAQSEIARRWREEGERPERMGGKSKDGASATTNIASLVVTAH